MTIIENVTLYKCEFCKKELKRKHAMILHETICNNNPVNFKACMNYCQHLEKKTVSVYFNAFGTDRFGDAIPGYDVDKEVFYCNKHEKLMYPFNIERKGLPNKYPETYEQQEPMPNECKEFAEPDSDNFLENIFNI